MHIKPVTDPRHSAGTTHAQASMAHTACATQTRPRHNIQLQLHTMETPPTHRNSTCTAHATHAHSPPQRQIRGEARGSWHTGEAEAQEAGALQTRPQGVTGWPRMASHTPPSRSQCVLGSEPQAPHTKQQQAGTAATWGPVAAAVPRQPAGRAQPAPGWVPAGSA